MGDVSKFWDNIARSTVRELAKAAGLRVSNENAVADLTATYGPTPSADFVNEYWNVLRDGWLTRSAPHREAVVSRMRTLERGDMSIKVKSRAGQIAYLRSLRRSPALAEAVLEVFLESGSETRVIYHAYTDPPANAEEQRVRFLTAIRDQWRALRADNIESFERAVFDTIVTTLQSMTLQIDDPTGAAQRVTSTVALAFVDPGILQPSEGELQDYQRVIVERLVDNVPDIDAVGRIMAYFTAAIEEPLGNQTKTLGWLIQWSAAVFMANLAYPGNEGAPEGIVGAITDAQARFYDNGASSPEPNEQAPSRESLDFDELLTEIMMGVPNCTPPARLDSGALAWRVFVGSAVINVFRDPITDAAPPLIRFSSPLITNLQVTGELLETINVLNARENLLKFYWSNDTVWLEQEFFVGPLHDRLFIFELQRFAGAADALDSSFRDRFGGTMAGADQKAVFDA